MSYEKNLESVKHLGKMMIDRYAAKDLSQPERIELELSYMRGLVATMMGDEIGNARFVNNLVEIYLDREANTQEEY